MKNAMSRKQLTAEILGWYGILAILSAYTLVSFDVIEGSGLTYQVLNLTGALGVIAIAAYKKVKQSIVLNIFWGAVAIVAIVNILT
jgi:branched-subunit amino acid transport protein AzlD